MSDDGVSRRTYLQITAAVGGATAGLIHVSDDPTSELVLGGGGGGGGGALLPGGGGGGGGDSILRVDAGEQYRVSDSSLEQYDSAILDGTILLDGTLRLG